MTVLGRPLQVTVPPMLRYRCPVLSVCLSVMLVYCEFVAKRLDDQDATWYGGRPRPRPAGDPAHLPPHGKGHSSPHFRPMSIVAKRSPISATAELLLGLLVHQKYGLLQTVWESLRGTSPKYH